MYTKRIFSPVAVLSWTRREIVLLSLIAAIPVTIYDVLGQRWLHLPWLPIAMVGTAVAFIISFQNNAAYGRTWEARKIWGGIVNTSRAWALMLNDFVTDHFTDEPVGEEELRKIRVRMAKRHVAWMTGLRHALRAKRPWETADTEHTNREWQERVRIHEHHVSIQEDMEGYLPEDEVGLACGMSNPPSHVLALQSKDLRRLRERDLIEDFRHMEMQQLLTTLLEHQGKAERIKNFPYPRQYATMNSVLLWIFLILVPFGLVHEFAQIGVGMSDTYDWVEHVFVWLSLPFSVIVMWVFHTMERIGRVSENPFEGSVNDIPITTMARGIEIDIRQIVGDDPADIPPPIEPRHDTQI